MSVTLTVASAATNFSPSSPTPTDTSYAVTPRLSLVPSSSASSPISTHASYKQLSKQQQICFSPSHCGVICFLFIHKSVIDCPLTSFCTNTRRRLRRLCRCLSLLGLCPSYSFLPPSRPFHPALGVFGSLPILHTSHRSALSARSGLPHLPLNHTVARRPFVYRTRLRPTSPGLVKDL